MGVGGALLIAVLLFLCWRRRRRSTYSPAPEKYSSAGGNSDGFAYTEVPREASGDQLATTELVREEHTPSHIGEEMEQRSGPAVNAPLDPVTGVKETESIRRHEMDARSIDFDHDDDNDDDTRSLEDIERAHRQ